MAQALPFLGLAGLAAKSLLKSSRKKAKKEGREDARREFERRQSQTIDPAAQLSEAELERRRRLLAQSNELSRTSLLSGSGITNQNTTLLG